MGKKLLDRNTFGSSLGAITLVDIINERGINYKKIGALLNKFNKNLGVLNILPNENRLYLGGLIFENAKKRCEDFDTEMCSYTKNVLTAKYNVFRKNNRAYVAKKNRNLW